MVPQTTVVAPADTPVTTDTALWPSNQLAPHHVQVDPNAAAAHGAATATRTIAAVAATAPWPMAFSVVYSLSWRGTMVSKVVFISSWELVRPASRSRISSAPPTDSVLVGVFTALMYSSKLSSWPCRFSQSSCSWRLPCDSDPSPSRPKKGVAPLLRTSACVPSLLERSQIERGIVTVETAPGFLVLGPIC